MKDQGKKDGETRPGVLRQARLRLVAWRARYGGRGRAIPAELWAEAVALARAEGVERTARELGLDRRRLARRVQAEPCAPTRTMVVEGPASMEFVELDCEAVCARVPTVVQLHGSDGERVQIDMSGASVADVLAVVRAFWSRPRCCS